MSRGAQALRLLSAGAAKGLIEALAPAFETRAGMRIEATFDAAGAIRDAFLNGRCDAVILPSAMLDALASQHRIDRATVAAVGSVPTGIAVPTDDPLPAVQDATALRDTLLAASALYCPDTVRSTAGMHFVGLLRALGIHDRSQPKLRTYANGARAMAALAARPAQGALGCTQVTEIRYTRGVTLVAPLPPPFELSTVYAIGVSQSADSGGAARALIETVTGSESAQLRKEGGFLPVN